MRTWLGLGGAAIVPVLMLAGCANTGSLGGTSWNVVEVMSTDEPDLFDMDVEFGKDGWVNTKVTRDDGSVETYRNKYSVHRSLLVVTREQGDLELLHRLDGNELVLTDENFQTRLRRTN